jgi:hypothetical protein
MPKKKKAPPSSPPESPEGKRVISSSLSQEIQDVLRDVKRVPDGELTLEHVAGPNSKYLSQEMQDVLRRIPSLPESLEGARVISSNFMLDGGYTQQLQRARRASGEFVEPTLYWNWFERGAVTLEEAACLLHGYPPPDQSLLIDLWNDDIIESVAPYRVTNDKVRLFLDLAKRAILIKELEATKDGRDWFVSWNAIISFATGRDTIREGLAPSFLRVWDAWVQSKPAAPLAGEEGASTASAPSDSAPPPSDERQEPAAQARETAAARDEVPGEPLSAAEVPAGTLKVSEAGRIYKKYMADKELPAGKGDSIISQACNKGEIKCSGKGKARRIDRVSFESWLYRLGESRAAKAARDDEIRIRKGRSNFTERLRREKF